MFEKTLTDVVRGIRASKRDTGLYISQVIAEIKTEINSSDMFVKANALQKLTFLQMMGYGMTWASFATIEVMSSPRFAHKRVGYLAASQSFTQETDVILLTTNLLKKELRGAVGTGMHGVYEAGLAVNCISNIVTEDLARDLLPELTNLTSHPQPYLRKKAILCLFKVFVKYPQGLRLTFPKLQQCLNDPDSSVVSCAVNVITELSDKNPKNYLHLAPAFFELLTQSSNNWMLIKVVKLLGSLVPEEPRLARKLLEPLANIVKNTKAKSLLFEAVHTITLCLPYCRKSDGSMPAIVPDIVTLCAQTLRSFVEEADQNLKYLGLVGFGSLMQSHPRVLSAPDYRPLILACLSDEDVTIRTRALDLLGGMASRKNLMDFVTQLLKHVELASGSYKHDLVSKIVEMCSGDKYALLQDFVWYLDVLFQLGHMRGLDTHASLLRAQVTDVALRVLPVRTYAVRRSMEILLEGEGDVSDDPYGDNGRGKNIMPEILPATAWIVGEYSDLIREALSLDEDDEEEDDFFFDDESKGTYHALIQALTIPSNTQKLPSSTQKVYVQAAMKVLAAAAADMAADKIELEACVATVSHNLPVYTQGTDVEVVERAFTSLELLRSLGLISGLMNGAPDLAPIDDDSDEGADGDLLGMVPGSSNITPAKQSGSSTSMSSSKSLAGRVREASATLNYLLKPAPMKPAGGKAQRKKRQSGIGVNVDLEAPVDLSVFEDLIDEEAAYRAKSKLSMESVSFTQQTPLQVKESASTPSRPTMELPPMVGISSSDEPMSFHNPMPGTAFGSRQREGDPFYLDSARGGEDDRDQANRFGTIQLVDSDEDEMAGDRKHKKRHKKKSKRSKSKPSADASTGGSLMSFGAASNATPSPSRNTIAAVTVYESDDDEDVGSPGSIPVRRGKGPGKEFAGLAKVDLTTPLREDEVMPERKHRVVPEHSTQEPSPDAKAKKKSKKNKKRSSKKQAGDTVGDLLDLGGFGPMAERETPSLADPASLPKVTPMSTNPINDAFDDLLGLSAPAPGPPPPLGATLSSSSYSGPLAVSGADASQPIPIESSKESSKRPWIKGTVKAASASGSPVVDWSKIDLAFRVRPTDDGGSPAAMAVVRLQNNMDLPVNNLSMDLKDHGSIELGSISPGSFTESAKIGPFVYSKPDTSQDIKGTLKTSECSVPIKICLPASLHLSPEEGLSLERVAEEFSEFEWSSSSVKLSIVNGTSADSVKRILRSFLRAGEVHEESSSPSVFTLAARSSGGCRIRVLVKCKETSVKMDVKSTDARLGKALASDLKHVLL